MPKTCSFVCLALVATLSAACSHSRQSGSTMLLSGEPDATTKLPLPSLPTLPAPDAVAVHAPVEEAPPTEPIEAISPALLTTCAEQRSVVIYKAARELELRCGGALAARFSVSLGFEPVGAKRQEGDGRTPEGDYFVSGKWSSQYHRSLQLAYPNAIDAARGLDEGQITQSQHDSIVHAVRSCRQPPQNTALGSLIQIHGAGGGPDVGDWTLGCVALNNDAIEAVFAFQRPGCDSGQPKTIIKIRA